MKKTIIKFLKWTLNLLGYKEPNPVALPYYIENREVLAPIRLSCKVEKTLPDKYIASKLAEGLVEHISENMMLRSEHSAEYPLWDRRAGIIAFIEIYIRKPKEPRIDF